jgi:transcriptional regulator with XRE-family HTH domain
MRLADKLRYLRQVEGSLRGLDRPMTQLEVVAAVSEECGRPISQSYLSQIENGSRHMTRSRRTLLAQFFRVHPGFLVDDPQGYHTELASDLRATEGQLDESLFDAAERFASDPAVRQALLKLARHEDTRGCLLLLGQILDVPGLVERLLATLGPEPAPERARAGRDEWGTW